MVFDDIPSSPNVKELSSFNISPMRPELVAEESEENEHFVLKFQDLPPWRPKKGNWHLFLFSCVTFTNRVRVCIGEKSVYTTYVCLLQWKNPKETNIFQVLLSVAGLLFMSTIFFDTDSTSIIYVPCTSNRGHLKCDDLILQQPPTQKNPLVVLLVNLEKEEKDKIRSLMFVWIWGRITHWCLT